MKILVLNGSPKGSASITLQTVHYISKLFPQHEFEILHVGARIKSLEKDFSPALEAMEKADGLLFSYPVYTFIAPYQLHRFIELMKEHSAPVAGKWASQITTSKHFYDVTAHRYIEDNCADMGLHYIPGLSADMEDLTKEKGRTEAVKFWEHLCWQVEKGYWQPSRALSCGYESVPATIPEGSDGEKSGDVVIIADMGEDTPNLLNMVERFRRRLGVNSRVVNLREYPFRGGCLGCFNCASDGKCVYNDGFDEFLRTKIQSAQAMVYAFEISDHSMGARFKLYDDRQFCNGHRTVTIGMPVGYLISGDYTAETNLQTIIEGRAEVGSNILAGIATDERETDAAVDRLCDSLMYALEHKNTTPSNFYGVGGMKIFRDLIYQMRGMMKADHRFFKSHGQYDFPQKEKGKIMLMYLVGMLNTPKMKAKLGGKMTEGMLMPYKKVLDELDKKLGK
ncbi:MAG: NAD(P)H-dependent oxidoreductase [Oscillospiraceae bacterium]|nr:NAD(P)H-dependent oxidoreductase [Oscillospiraceae bacterium]